MVQIAETFEQPLGQRLGIATRQGAIKNHLQQFVVRHGIGATLGEPITQPVTMGVAVQLRPLGGATRHGPHRAANTPRHKPGRGFVKGKGWLLGHGRSLRKKG